MYIYLMSPFHSKQSYIYIYIPTQTNKQTAYIPTHCFEYPIMEWRRSVSNFQDLLPLMAERLGGDGLIGELCNGFEVLMDKEKGVITFESLKNNSALLGLQDLTDNDLRCMLEEGDSDGDGALDQMEFCVLMFRLSPELMEQSQFLLEEALFHLF
ncbi:unnamed protein product [Cuscuta epithymum]|uniref:EF-hand domain-containing protein n=2 Tax=Cuscuta epithymum TaxID=186058 RepID=A0AAV0FJ36_9ASTE|nr:unnamed protein product [Cuscuta epithymum]